MGATGSSVTRGNMAVLRCVVPSFVRDFLSVTSWLQDQKFNIYPSSEGGKFVSNNIPYATDQYLSLPTVL